MSANVKLILAAVFAVALALKADLATPPLPEDVRAYVSWLLTGLLAGVGTVLGPDLANAVRAALAAPAKADPL